MIQFTSITKNAGGSWTFQWTATPDINYRVVLFGVQLAVVSSGSYTWTAQEYATYPPPLEVVPVGQLAFSEVYPAYVTLQWYGEPAAGQYYIQQSPDGSSAWGTIYKVQETGQWVYSFTTVTLNDGITYYYRVIAIDPLGNQAAPLDFQKLVVTPPRPPDGLISVSYNNPNLVVATL